MGPVTLTAMGLAFWVNWTDLTKPLNPVKLWVILKFYKSFIDIKGYFIYFNVWLMLNPNGEGRLHQIKNFER